MKNWGNSRVNYLNNKAQSLTELATFGSVLLLVMSFFVRYGMNYIYQQDINMRAFRMALNDAYNTATDSSSSLTVIKDKHMPDPQDTFGIGNVVSVQGGGDVVWGNTLQDKPEDPSDLSKIPRIKFVINEVPHEYTTADYNTVAQGVAPYADGFYVKLPNRDTREWIDWERVHCFKPEGALEPQAMVLLSGNETEIINELASSDKSPMKQIIRILPTGLSHGNAVTGFDVLDRQAGQINPDYFALNADLYDDGNYDGNPDVIPVNLPDGTPANLQGLLPTDVTVNRRDTLSLEERSAGGGHYKSVDNITTSVTVTHKIRKNRLNEQSEVVGTEIVPFPETYNINGVSKTWQTPK